MPNQRAPGQRLITIPMSDSFIASLRGAIARSGLGDRSKFVRAAVLEKLQRMGFDLPAEIAAPPSRERAELAPLAETAAPPPPPPGPPQPGVHYGKIKLNRRARARKSRA